MKVLVTGGAGYIGSHTCKALSTAGHMPIVFDNLIYGHRWAVRWGPFVEGDIAIHSDLDAAMQRYKPDAVMHFAAFAYVGESVQHPAKYYENNVAGTLSLLACMRKHGINRLVFSSTCATYGEPLYTPIDENHPQLPINPYGSSKLMIEQILRDYDRAYGLKSICLRYFNAAGADPDSEIGESHEPETHLIPLVLDVACGKRQQIKIFGTNYDTPDGTCIRDYIHVMDLADAHILALEYLSGVRESQSFNLGHGNGFSVRDVINVAKKVTGKEIKVIDSDRREGDPPILVGSSEKAIRVLKWQPRYDDIEVIIGTSWKWHNK